MRRFDDDDDVFEKIFNASSTKRSRIKVELPSTNTNRVRIQAILENSEWWDPSRVDFDLEDFQGDFISVVVLVRDSSDLREAAENAMLSLRTSLPGVTMSFNN